MWYWEGHNRKPVYAALLLVYGAFCSSRNSHKEKLLNLMKEGQLLGKKKKTFSMLCMTWHAVPLRFSPPHWWWQSIPEQCGCLRRTWSFMTPPFLHHHSNCETGFHCHLKSTKLITPTASAWLLLLFSDPACSLSLLHLPSCSSPHWQQLCKFLSNLKSLTLPGVGLTLSQ